MEIKENAVQDSLVIDRFIKQIGDYEEVQMQLGEGERLILLNKASMIIRILTDHCMMYGIGIPASDINNVMRENK